MINFKKRLYQPKGISLIRMPITGKDSSNAKKKDIRELEATTAANMIGVTGIKLDSPMILCGKHSKAYPILRQLVKMSSLPYVIIGTMKDFENSCLNYIQTDWDCDSVPPYLPDGNGKMILKTGAETNFMLKEVISNWNYHLVIICLGNGLQVDSELLNLLNGLGRYIIVSESLSRCVKGSEGYKLTVEELLESMDYILVSSIRTSAKKLMAVLPSYECEKVTNTTDFSFHLDRSNDELEDRRDRNGGGFRIAQARSLETKCILTQENLTNMQDNNIMLIYNAKMTHTWVAKIVR